MHVDARSEFKVIVQVPTCPIDDKFPPGNMEKRKKGKKEKRASLPSLVFPCFQNTYSIIRIKMEGTTDSMPRCLAASLRRAPLWMHKDRGRQILLSFDQHKALLTWLFISSLISLLFISSFFQLIPFFHYFFHSSISPFFSSCNLLETSSAE